MATDITKLRVQAIRAGHDRATVRGMDEDELRSLLNGKGSKRAGKSAARSATKARASKATASKRTSTKAKATTSKRGTTTRKASTAGKASGRGAASRTPAKQAKRGATSRTTKADANSGRHVVGRLNWRKKGFSPREGSLKAEVFAALKDNDGDKVKAYRVLSRRLKTLYKGVARERAESLLAYQIARVTWEFAQATDQHVKSTNRVEYGTGGTGTGRFQRAGTKAPAKRGRPKGSTSKSTPAKRGPGRPKGSTTKTRKPAAKGRARSKR